MEMERRPSLPPASSTWKQPLRGLEDKAWGRTALSILGHPTSQCL